jgi:hypothetical protein
MAPPESFKPELVSVFLSRLVLIVVGWMGYFVTWHNAIDVVEIDNFERKHMQMGLIVRYWDLWR